MSTFLIEKATKVKLRGRVNKSKEFVSLYLDYQENKERKYEFLPDKMYHKPKDRNQKDHNAIVLRAAKEKLNLKNLMLLKDNTQLQSVLSSALFVDFFEFAKNQAKPDGDKKEYGTKLFYDHSLSKIKEFTSLEKLRIKDIDQKWIWKYRDFLIGHKIAKSTAAAYFQNLAAIFQLAIKKGYIDKSPMLGVDPIKKGEPEVNYIFFEDLQKLKITECKPMVKKAGLFASQTGLRASDMKALEWEKMDLIDDLYRVVVTQEKTDKPYVVHFKKSLIDIIGPIGKGKVFPDLKNDIGFNAEITLWFERAGIKPRGNPDKRFTLHDFRHTYAIILGMNGANLYEISQMLGHREISTTERYYARILDQVKQKIVNKLPEL